MAHDAVAHANTYPDYRAKRTNTYPDYPAILDYQNSPEPARQVRVSSCTFNGNEFAYVMEALARKWVTQGEFVQRFEEAFARFVGVRNAIACSSGSAALHLALKALGVKAGDQVALPAMTYVATANAVVQCGAVPVFVDVDRDTWCIDPGQVPADVNGVIPVHMYGLVADLSALDKCDRWVLEDAAQAHGAAQGGRQVGAIGDAGAFSFYASKIIACGEGGMVTTNNDKVARSARLYRGQGVDPTRRYWHEVQGFNYRMTDLSAAIGLAQLEQYPGFATCRRALMDMYVLRLGGVVTFQPRTDESADWVAACLLPTDADSAQVAERMLLRGVETRPFFPPLITMPAYFDPKAQVPVARELARRGICLPLHCEMAPEDAEYVCDELLRALR